jgi:PAS domain S-box-containing protein
VTDSNRSIDAELARERSSAPAAPRASEAQLETLFDRAPIGVYLVDAELRIRKVNPAARQAFGEIPELIGRGFEEVMHMLWQPEVANEMVRRFQHTLCSGESYVAPGLVTERRDRSAMECYEWQIDRIPLPPERDGVVCYFRDISASKRAEDAVQRAAEADGFRVTLADTLRPLADPSAIQAEAIRILAEHLQATRVFYCEVPLGQEDAVFARCFGDGVGRVVGPLRLDDYGPTSIRMMRAGHRVVVADVHRGPMLTDQEEATYVASGVAAHMSVPLNKDGRLAAFLGVSQSTPREWTSSEVALVEETAERMWAAVQRARAQTVLREREERLRRAIAIETVGVIFFHPEGRLIEANDAFLRMSGYSREELLAGVVRWDTMTPPEFMPPSCRAIEQLMTMGRTVPYEKQYIRKDGSRWWGLFAAMLLSQSEGVEFIIDVTERKHAEEALKAADRHKDEFLATLSHELRNPLAPVRHALTMLDRADDVSPRVHRLLQMMDRQVDNLVRMVDDLLEVSRISRGKIELRTELVDMRTIVDSAIETSRPLIDAAEHQLLVSLPPTPLDVMVDPLRISQVMANLLNNAAKYTQPGGRIWLTAGEEGNDVVISVRDDGVGIPPHMLPRIFEMFMQMDPDHKQAQGGLGIGLAVVRKLVEMHDGTVEARSAGPGEGSELIVRLPRAQPARSATAAPVSTLAAVGEPSRGSGGARARARILVVDDNDDAATTLGMLLEAVGHDVRVVLDGPAALEAVGSQRPHVVLLDLGMPGMSGYEVAQHLREDPACAGITLVALTGWGQDEDRRRTQAAGFDHHLVKPVGLAALEELLASAFPQPPAP